MRRFITLATGMLTVLCWVVTPGWAATQQSYSGKIMMVDPKLRIIIVKGKEGEEVFHPATNSTFMIGGEMKLLSQLRKGEEVTVTYQETDRSSAPANAGSH